MKENEPQAVTEAPDEAESASEEAVAPESEAPAETPSTDRDALAAAIEENPEAVAAFVERLDVVNELLDLVALGEGAMDDEMVVRLAGTADVLAESADGLATRETIALSESVGQNGEDLADAMESIVELQRSGTLDDLTAAADIVSLLSGAMDDEMVTSLAGTANSLGELADTASDPDAVRGIQTMLTAVGDASSPDEAPKRVGMLGMVKAMRDPDVQRGMGFLIGLASALGQETARRAPEER